MLVRFTIPGDPVAKGRARSVTRRGKGGASYIAHITPEKTEQYEARVAVFAQQAMAGRPVIEGPVALSVTALFPIPPSWTRKRQAAARAGTERHTKRPDADNCAKAVLDGLNGVVWKDDSQVVTLSIEKRYAEVPRVEVLVVPLTEEGPTK